MIFLDTHVVIWLYTKQIENFSDAVLLFLSIHKLGISPIVILELQYLHQIKRIEDSAHTILLNLKNQNLATVDSTNWENITINALDISWTRDVFDRYIIAHADFLQSPLITKDRKILQHYPLAISPDTNIIEQKH